MLIGSNHQIPLPKKLIRGIKTAIAATGAHAVKVWKISTAALNDYARSATGTEETFSRYGQIADLNAQTQEMLLNKDRSFIFNIDKLDQDETAQQLEAGKALARELREVVVPEIDTYVYNTMVTNAGTTKTEALTSSSIYSAILAGSQTLDDAEVPDSERVFVLTPASYTLLKTSTAFDNTTISEELKAKGVVGMLDGMAVVKVPAARLPENFGFMIAPPSATAAPVKLEDFGMHPDTPLSSGTIVTGRICYDA